MMTSNSAMPYCILQIAADVVDAVRKKFSVEIQPTTESKLDFDLTSQ